MIRLSFKAKEETTTDFKVEAEVSAPPRLTIAVPTKVVNTMAKQQEPFVASWEEHLILRLPLSLAQRLRRDLSEESTGERHELFQAACNPPDDLAIQFEDDDDDDERRRVRLRVEGRWWRGVLVDRPSIVETLRASHDRSLYYKVGDVGQMIIIYETEREAREAHQQLSTQHWQWPHGITTPLHHHRWPQTTLMRRVEELEERVAQLIQKDELATRSEVTLYDPHGNVIQQGEREEENLHLEDDEEDEEHLSDDMHQNEAGDMVDDLLEQLGDHDLEEEEADEQEEEDLMDLAAEINDNMREERQAGLAKAIAEKREQLSRITNPAIRARLEEVIRQLEAEMQ